MPDLISVHITVSSGAEAGKIARALVEEKLAACVNIVPQILSIYRWQGRVEEAEETLLLVKTRVDLFAPLCKLVKTLHTAECPCILVEPIVGGLPAYLDWVAKETRP
jgi:periplasmic divalent cation tolerance protein